MLITAAYEAMVSWSEKKRCVYLWINGYTDESLKAIVRRVTSWPQFQATLALTSSSLQHIGTSLQLGLFSDTFVIGSKAKAVRPVNFTSPRIFIPELHLKLTLIALIMNNALTLYIHLAYILVIKCPKL